MVNELLTLVKRRCGPYYLAAGPAVQAGIPTPKKVREMALGRTRFHTVSYITNRTAR